jgi:hypothetical protein
MLVPWLAEAVRTLPGLVASYAWRGPLDPRTRQHIILAVTEVNGCRYSAWIHSSWRDFLGDLDQVEYHDALIGYARACAGAGRPLPPEELRGVVPDDVIRSVRATVAQTSLTNMVGNTVDGMLERLTGARPRSPLAFAREAATVAAAVPIAIPLLATASVMRLATTCAPSMAPVEMPPVGEANLLAHLLATAAPIYLANAAARLALLRLPSPVAIGVRSGRSAATVRFGRGALVIENGVSSDALVVVEGDVEPLLELATGSILRELSAIRLRGR